MTSDSQTATLLVQAEERLRQERETFEQRRRQDAHWFRLRLTMGFIAAVFLPALAIAAAYILFLHDQFPASVVTTASAVMFVDVTGLVIAVWKLVLNPASATGLNPVTPAPPSMGQ